MRHFSPSERGRKRASITRRNSQKKKCQIFYTPGKKKKESRLIKPSKKKNMPATNQGGGGRGEHLAHLLSHVREMTSSRKEDEEEVREVEKNSQRKRGEEALHLLS